MNNEVATPPEETVTPEVVDEQVEPNEFEELVDTETEAPEVPSVEPESTPEEAPEVPEETGEETVTEQTPEEAPTEVEPAQSEEVEQAPDASELQQQQEEFDRSLTDYYKQVVNKDEVFDDDTAAALTNMATTLHKTVLQTVEEQLAPRIVQTMASQQQSAAIESQFYTEWPELKNGKAQDTVMRLAQAYRQANPNVDVERSIKEVGAAAMMTLGYSRTPTVAAAPAQRAGFKPAGVRTSTVTPVSDNEFSQLADDTLAGMA